MYAKIIIIIMVRLTPVTPYLTLIIYNIHSGHMVPIANNNILCNTSNKLRYS